MSRPVRSDISNLLQESRAMEMLASEADVPADRLQDYWTLSADLIALVSDIEELQVSNPTVTYQDPAMFSLKYRLRGIASRLTQLDGD